MSNENTKKQIRDFIERAIEKSKTPDKREEMKKERQKRSARALKNYGL